MTGCGVPLTESSNTGAANCLESGVLPPVANANLTALGHVSFKANGATTAQLPGDISVEERPLPLLHEGSRVIIVAGDAPN